MLNAVANDVPVHAVCQWALRVTILERSKKTLEIRFIYFIFTLILIGRLEFVSSELTQILS